MTDQSSLSFIHPDAKIGIGTIVLPFSYVDKDVVIGDYCKIGPNATLLSGTRLGSFCDVFPGAVLGAVPQDLKFKGEYSTLVIGDRTVIREGATLNRGTQETGTTTVGNNCLIMAYVHIAHDCIIGDNVILSNGVQLAGHVHINDHAVLGGNVLVQQFCKIGRFSFVAGAGLVRNNVPPFVRVAREPLSYIGVNHIGLERKGFQLAEIEEIKGIYNVIFVQNNSFNVGISLIRDSFNSSIFKDEIISFFSHSKSMISRFKSDPVPQIHETNSQ
jgi:UDP-N-acetylglucosamine acyltransferase